MTVAIFFMRETYCSIRDSTGGNLMPDKHERLGASYRQLTGFALVSYCFNPKVTTEKEPLSQAEQLLFSRVLAFEAKYNLRSRRSLEDIAHTSFWRAHSLA